MITLHTFGRAFGLPDPSPFVVKAEVLLKMSGLSHARKTGDMRKAPKGKLPLIDDDGAIIPDSSFIRWHLEQKHGIDFSGGYSPAELGGAWAFEKLCEDNLYWAEVQSRWMIERNFEAGPAQFFKAVPAVIRPLVTRMVRSKIRRNLWGQGMGRHSQAEIERIASFGVDAIADFLGDKPFLLGDRPCGADATVFAFVASQLCPLFETPIRSAAERRPNLVAYRDRMLARYYPEGA